MSKKECPSCAMEIDEKEKECPICQYEFPKTNKINPIVALIIVIAILFMLVYSI